MPSQEEVFQAAKALGYWFTYRRLKEYFGMEKFTGEHHGSSNLSARNRKLVQDGRLVRVKVPGGAVFVVPPELYDVPEGEAEVEVFTPSNDVLAKVNNALYNERQTLEDVAERAGIDTATAELHLEYLADEGIITRVAEYYTVFDITL